MSVLPLLSLQCINKGKSRRRAANRGGTTTTTNARRSIYRRQQVHPIIVCALCPVQYCFPGIAPGVAFVRWFVLILKLRCHFKGIRNGNRMPASGRDRVKKRITWMDVIFSSPCSLLCSEFVIVSAVFFFIFSTKRPLHMERRIVIIYPAETRT